MTKRENNFEEIERKFQKVKKIRETYNRLILFNDTTINLMIKMERFSRNDKGRNYTLSISENGFVTYNGIKNVKNLGVKEYVIKKEQLKNILKKFDEIYFFSQENCESDDINLTKLSLTIENDMKEILFSNDNSKCAQLIGLSNYIDDITSTKVLV